MMAISRAPAMFRALAMLRTWAVPRASAIGGLIIVFVSGPAAAADDSPFRVDEKQFQRQIKHVALAPLNVVAYFDLAEATQRELEAEATAILTKKKFDVLPVDVYRAIRDTMIDRVGGIRDAKGDYYPQRVAVVWDHSKRELLFRNAVDGIVTVSIAIVQATFQNDRAEWDGVKQKVKSKGGGKYGGPISAASVRVAVVDRQDRVLFSNGGGIELLQERVGGQLHPVPKEGLLKDNRQLMQALEIALKPL